MTDFAQQVMLEKSGEIQGRWKMQVATKDRGAAVEFLFTALDELITYVEGQFDGLDKKALVLQAVGGIYDVVVVGLLPFWLKPFAGLVRSFVVDTVASVAVDFIVRKYNEGGWRR